MASSLQLVANCLFRKSFSYSAPFFILPAENHNYLICLLFIIGASFISFKYIKKINFFNFFSINIIFIITTASFIYPKFNFIFMIIFTCILTILTLPIELFDGFFNKQKYLLIQVLQFLEKTLILDYLSVIFVKFFCVPSNIFYKRLCGIFCISLCYIIGSRFNFIQMNFITTPLTGVYSYVLYIILFLGVSVIYLRILVNISMFFVFSAVRLNPSLLSPSILFVLGIEDQYDLPPKAGAPKEIPASDRKYSLINVSLTRQYFRQHFTNSHPTSFKFLGYCIAFCGTAAAVGTFWYSKIQAEQATIQAQQAIIQAEQAKQQTYHTAREADVAAVEAGLLTREEYFHRHPEDVTVILKTKK